MKEEIIYKSFDQGWRRELPVKLITCSRGSMDLQRQTGSGFDEAIAEADKILAKRGLKRDQSEPWGFGSEGAYQAVKRIAETG